MKRVRKCSAFLLVAALAAATTANASARFDHHNGIQVASAEVMVAQGANAPRTTVYTYYDGQMQGEGAGNNISTGANFFGGFAGGALLGLIGTGIVYFTTEGAEPRGRDLMRIQDRGTDFVQGYTDG